MVITVQQIRTVNVSAFVDTQAPVITLNGAASVNLSLGDTYVEQGARAVDNVDGDISNLITVSGSVDTSVAGTYRLIYSVSDNSDNSATAIRTVNVNGGSSDTLVSASNPFFTGQEIVIQYNEGTGSRRDWIGIYAAGSEPISGRGHSNYLDWAYTNGRSGTARFDSLPTGDYTAILFSNNSWNFYGEAASFSVIADPNGPPPGADVITIKKAEFKAKKGELKVEAKTSAGKNTQLVVVGFGPMKAKGSKFKFKQKGYPRSDIPATLTVTSSNGGTATIRVKFK